MNIAAIMRSLTIIESETASIKRELAASVNPETIRILKMPFQDFVKEFKENKERKGAMNNLALFTDRIMRYEVNEDSLSKEYLASGGPKQLGAIPVGELILIPEWRMLRFMDIGPKSIDALRYVLREFYGLKDVCL